MNTQHEQPGPLNLNVAGRNDLSSSWIREGALDVSRRNSEVRGVENRKSVVDSEGANCEGVDGKKVECMKGSIEHYEGVKAEQKHKENLESETSSSKPPRLASKVEEYDHKNEGLMDSEVGGSEGELTAGKSKSLLSSFLDFKVLRYST